MVVLASGMTRRKQPDDLRKRGQQALRARNQSKDPSRLVHELEVHRVELELQNEELRHAREATETALERFREVFDFAPIGYAILTLDGTISEINLAGARLLAFERAKLIDKAFVAFVVDVTGFNALIANAKQATSPAGAELELRRDDSVIPVRMMIAMLPRMDSRLMLAFEDISDRKAKEAELARTEQALRDANRRKDEFLAMLSHELRNPLSPIRTSVSVLQLAPAGSDAARSAIEIIDRSAAHLTRLVEDLLDVTRVTRGKIELQCEYLDLAALVRRVVEDHRREFDGREIALDLRGAKNVWVHGDPARLVQVVSNLLTNAHKFTQPRGSVLVVVENTTDLVTVRVSDNGIGIAPEVIGNLFEPFVQAPQSLDRKRGGLGLGLAMVKALVELHWGRAGIRSPGIGRGSEAWFTLPRAQQATRSDAPPALTRSPRRRILIIEDKQDTALSLRNALVLKGHDVAIASDGRSGLELAGRFRPEVVFCDIGLPDIDGYAVARALRTHLQHDMYLVALSGYAQAEDIARATAAGFARHLAKPATVEQLEQVLASAPSSADSAVNVLH
jgi:PAS domain S-box-containing protein